MTAKAADQAAAAEGSAPSLEDGAVMSSHCRELLLEMSREMSLACDLQGVILWADERAARLLDAREGMALEQLAAPGAELKLRQLVAAGSARAVHHWELALAVRGTLHTVAFEARPIAGGTMLVGSLIPEAYGSALTRMAATMSEIADLHRKTETQQRELQWGNDERLRLHHDLAESIQGVVALHAELDEKSSALHRVSEIKTRVIANVSHEFRTPLNAILGLTDLLLDRNDGELTKEQAKQIGFIRTSAEALSLLTNDLLDLSTVETGKLALRTASVDVHGLFTALRGMLRPLIGNDALTFIVEDPPEPIHLETDEGKLAQILRNLVSNAGKFTERGEVRVSAACGPEGTITFSVDDTGIGIRPEHLHRIFEEFTQIEGPLQAKTKGTGLGLALSRKLAELLGGDLTVESEAGRGSTFFLTIPRVHPDVSAMDAMVERSRHLDPNRTPVLVVEDDRQELFFYEKHLADAGFQILPTRTVDDARAILQRARPAAIVLDIMLEGESTWAFLAEIKANPDTHDIPTFVVTVTDREQKARALGADEFFVKPMEREWLLEKLQRVARNHPVQTILIIDDDDVARYIVKKHLQGLPYEILEAPTGAEGIRLARARRPQGIVLDFVMPDMSGFDALDELKKDPATCAIPVIVNTSKDLGEEERVRLTGAAAAVVSKQSLSREMAVERIREALVNAGVPPKTGE